jgi:hypothetical protein
VQILRILQAASLGRALGIEAPAVVYAAFIPLITLIMQIPIPSAPALMRLRSNLMTDLLVRDLPAPSIPRDRPALAMKPSTPPPEAHNAKAAPARPRRNPPAPARALRSSARTP